MKHRKTAEPQELDKIQSSATAFHTKVLKLVADIEADEVKHADAILQLSTICKSKQDFK